MDPINSNKFKLFINGKFAGHMNSNDGVISIPVEMLENVGIINTESTISVEIAKWDEDDTQDGECK